MAHKKAAGSTKNLTDSNPKYRGLKLAGGQKALAGNIILKQKGSRYIAGPNAYMSKDFTIHAAAAGTVRFYEKKVTGFDKKRIAKTFVAVETA